SAPHRDLHSFPTRRSSHLLTRSVVSPLPTYRSVPVGVPADWPKSSVPVATVVGAPRLLVAVPPTTRLIKLTWTTCPAIALWPARSEEHTSELQSPCNLVCR